MLRQRDILELISFESYTNEKDMQKTRETLRLSNNYQKEYQSKDLLISVFHMKELL